MIQSWFGMIRFCSGLITFDIHNTHSFRNNIILTGLGWINTSIFPESGFSFQLLRTKRSNHNALCHVNSDKQWSVIHTVTFWPFLQDAASWVLCSFVPGSVSHLVSVTMLNECLFFQIKQVIASGISRTSELWTALIMQALFVLVSCCKQQ